MSGQIEKLIKRANKRPPIIVIGPSIAYIPLTQGQFALVDVEDAPALGTAMWFAHWDQSIGNYYVKTKSASKHVSMHRFLLRAEKGLQVDHISGNTLDNRRCNLRIATNNQNAINRRLRKDSKSGLKGACWDPKHQSWIAQIQCNYVHIHLGRFPTPEEAHCAYVAAAKDLHGDFARIS